METVIVSEYNPEWTQNYEQEKIKIFEALNSLVQGIEHIGSTSVPGLGSKPIIDIMVGVSDLNQITEKQINDLGSIGYTYVEKPDFPERKFFRRGEWRAGTHHLHIYKYKSANWVNNILFREYMRKDLHSKVQYYNLKKKLENEFKHDRAAYTKGKSGFIQDILSKARNDQELRNCF
ncbi:GrpB family protein [Paenibacillus sp. HJL G12]|uniref:GrpB family protein n=1 Tax=Paenibacillus dendrobii TaxID=2691084 RepID=A0A7X3IIT9_9BACL|nr:GrpB family protein [Paenibacillus dendrobii]MWV43365.1 GrpB family protein [Paenibacillus dendrobii]